MYSIDSTYPLSPTSSAQVITRIRGKSGMILPVMLNSSFVAGTERRHVELALSHRDNPDTPAYTADIVVDKRLPKEEHTEEGAVQDGLTIREMEGGLIMG